MGRKDLALWSLAASSGASFLLYMPVLFSGKAATFSYLPINLLIAWAAFGSTLLLQTVLKRIRWSSWLGIGISAFWLVLLPNTFYMISDYIHLRSVPVNSLLFYVALFTSFIINSLILGFLSIFLVHRELLKRVSARVAMLFVQLVILASSYGIYVGRVLRWNTWDIVTNFPSLVFDISDRLLHIFSYPTMISITASIYVLLASFYLLIWAFANLTVLRSSRSR